MTEVILIAMSPSAALSHLKRDQTWGTGGGAFDHTVFSGGCTPADVPLLIWRVCTHDEEIRTSFQLAMAGPGWQNDNIIGMDFESVSILTAENELGVTARIRALRAPSSDSDESRKRRHATVAASRYV